VPLSELNVDTFSLALIGGFPHERFQVGRHRGLALHTLGISLGVGVDLVAFTHIGEAVAEKRKHVRYELLAEAITSTQLLVYPHFHDSLLVAAIVLTVHRGRVV